MACQGYSPPPVLFLSLPRHLSFTSIFISLPLFTPNKVNDPFVLLHLYRLCPFWVTINSPAAFRPLLSVPTHTILFYLFKSWGKEGRRKDGKWDLVGNDCVFTDRLIWKTTRVDKLRWLTQ